MRGSRFSAGSLGSHQDIRTAETFDDINGASNWRVQLTEGVDIPGHGREDVLEQLGVKIDMAQPAAELGRLRLRR